MLAGMLLWNAAGSYLEAVRVAGTVSGFAKCLGAIGAGVVVGIAVRPALRGALHDVVRVGLPLVAAALMLLYRLVDETPFHLGDPIDNVPYYLCLMVSVASVLVYAAYVRDEPLLADGAVGTAALRALAFLVGVVLSPLANIVLTLVFFISNVDVKLSLVCAAVYVVLTAVRALCARTKPTPSDSREGVEASLLADVLEELGDAWGLTARERDVLAGLARGYTAQAIADSLGIARSTVTTHMRRIYDKAGIHTQQGLLVCIDRAYARRHGVSMTEGVLRKVRRAERKGA